MIIGYFSLDIVHYFNLSDSIRNHLPTTALGETARLNTNSVFNVIIVFLSFFITKIVYGFSKHNITSLFDRF